MSQENLEYLQDKLDVVNEYNSTYYDDIVNEMGKNIKDAFIDLNIHKGMEDIGFSQKEINEYKVIERKLTLNFNELEEFFLDKKKENDIMKKELNKKINDLKQKERGNVRKTTVKNLFGFWGRRRGGSKTVKRH